MTIKMVSIFTGNALSVVSYSHKPKIRSPEKLHFPKNRDVIVFAFARQMSPRLPLLLGCLGLSLLSGGVRGTFDLFLSRDEVRKLDGKARPPWTAADGRYDSMFI